MTRDDNNIEAVEEIGNIMVAPPVLQRPLRNKLQATEHNINRSSWYLLEKKGGGINILSSGTFWATWGEF